MTEYRQGHVKRNTETGSVAIRTQFPENIEQLRGMAWLVATHNLGARNALTTEVEEWDDLYVPPAPEAADE